MKKKCNTPFARSESGSLSVEAVLILPLLALAILVTMVLWDAFKAVNVNQKSTFTIADMLSRADVDITPDYLQTVHELHAFLGTQSGGNAVRITVVSMEEDPDTLVQSMRMLWSKGIGGLQDHEDLAAIEARIPEMAVGDQMIVVEGVQNWEPAFNVGLPSYNFREVAITRPRFAPELRCDPTLCPEA